jgi:hypothetical protein
VAGRIPDRGSFLQIILICSNVPSIALAATDWKVTPHAFASIFADPGGTLRRHRRLGCR